MRNRKKWLLPMVLILVAISIHFFSQSSKRVDEYYSLGVYPNISSVLKSAFGWLPFSLGDILYGVAGVFLVYTLAIFIKKAFRKQLTWAAALILIRSTSLIMLWIYVFFNLLWGINYNRTGIGAQIDIRLENYDTHDLITVDSLLMQKVNSSRAAIGKQAFSRTTAAEFRAGTIKAFRLAKTKYPFLHTDQVSLKPSMWGWLGNYLGFNGYYNPFTGEAQINTTVPPFIQPFIFCHETAHQLGYAKENEANFVGYLAAKESADTSFHYSVYLDLFLYAQRNLYFADSAAAKAIAKNLSPAVKADLTTLRNFNNNHRSLFEPIVSWLYGKYLKNNQQPAGTQTYDEVVGYLIAFYKKTGTI